MKIVVTGALGHIGSRLVRQLPQSFPQAEIVMVDNLLTQRYPSLFALPTNGHYRFVEADIMTADLDSLLAGADVVVHLAAITDAANSFQNPELTENTNLHGTELVARACARNGAAFIFLSTTSVYGSQDEVVDETCNELRPQSPYADSKLKSERLLQELGTNEGLNFVTLRFGTIFGTSAGMRFHTAVNKFIWQATLGHPITVWRTALDQRRPYLELGDAVNALCFVIERRLYDRAIYNVVTLNASVREIVDSIREYVPDLQVELVDTKIMNQLSYNVRNDRFVNLGFTFRGELKSGVAESLGLIYQLRDSVRAVFEAKNAVEQLQLLGRPNWSPQPPVSEDLVETR